MSLSGSLLVALFCMSVVFAVLASLFLIIRVFSAAIGVLTKKNTASITFATPSSEISGEKAVTQNEGEGEIFSSGTLKLTNVDDPTAAMIMAIVSDESGIPLYQLCFKSIKLITK